ncbi:class I SAM-dependent methyltransferase [Virgibacillus halophilus]|uniref:Class I SAM-dependent methyltransferase n=1 Tax=Tigheibacillus halophilus TaxID=361280 RepID=A0ABU5C318_9BACI|nr:class I SAM-dependent methyltransferase [Virgibacillus halophilus]
MHIRLHKRIDGSAVPIKSYAAQAEKLPFADDTFDAIVATLVFLYHS